MINDSISYIYNGILMTNDDLTFSSETQAIFGHIPMIPWDPPPMVPRPTERSSSSPCA